MTDFMQTETIVDLKEVLSAAGRDCATTPRSYYHKAVNYVLNHDLGVKIEIAPKGKVWTAKSGFKYNYCIIYNAEAGITKKKVFYTNGDVDAEIIFDSITQVVTSQNFKAIEKRTRFMEGEGVLCDRCGGKGIIPAFSHVCKGVCFKCLGIGYYHPSLHGLK